ncbi:MAG: formate--phosphoribosylaminoimidazolecarboxamide ligase [Chloroflexota bacterium]|nr:formate--phosphoribosylaminoimidazolecarboxamide ligase [Chloroflexota bacterium]
MTDIENTIHKTIKKLSHLSERDITITTLCSHSSLQIFHAAKKQGFRTLGILRKKDIALKDSYNIFPLAKPSEYYEVDEYPQVVEDGKELAAANAIFIPTGSAVEYLRIPGPKHGLELLPMPIYGTRKIAPFEFDRTKQREWLEQRAGLRMPQEITDPKQIDGPCVIKLKGAPGGRGSVVVTSYEEYKTFLSSVKCREEYDGATIQRFITGTRYYLLFLSTPFGVYNGSDMEFWGIDRRDESNADEFYKVGSRVELLQMQQPPTFNVTGNTQVVLRESLLLTQAIPAGRRTIDASKQLVPEGIVGPFCLETIVDPDSRMHVFEISARIVAGSNVLIPTSAYAPFTYPKQITYAERMMLDIREGLSRDELHKVAT